jgi:hypothetical protein
MERIAAIEQKKTVIIPFKRKMGSLRMIVKPSITETRGIHRLLNPNRP